MIRCESRMQAFGQACESEWEQEQIPQRIEWLTERAKKWTRNRVRSQEKSTASQGNGSRRMREKERESKFLLVIGWKFQSNRHTRKDLQVIYAVKMWRADERERERLGWRPLFFHRCHHLLVMCLRSTSTLAVHFHLFPFFPSLLITFSISSVRVVRGASDWVNDRL